ncbi:alpha-tocopherol transfer protein-like [Cimex lectularius]|uniref:CRAL-TRIO domain-containing protein n=1 Tax=Cimex lectularius TaxID=79782 RepID=A0A8I6SIS2_CIMLE|nr:alpha-tocopherol transfer protein-like [Cimex lectularius]
MKQNLDMLNARGKSRIYKAYGMTPQGIAEDVESIKNWLFKQPHLPQIQRELLSIQVDEWLENYLICCKNSVERAKENLDMYFTSKIIVPEVFTHRDPLQEAFKTSCQVMAIGFVPTLTDEGRKVFFFSHRRNTAEDFDPVVMMKRISMILDILLLEGIDFLGIEIIVDCKNVCLSHLTRYNLNTTKKVQDVGLKAYPQRIHRIHMVNPTQGMEMGMALFKPILSKKINDRFLVHRDLKDLVGMLGDDCVPSDLGGQAPSIDEINARWEEKLIAYRDWFQCNDGIKSDESKRVGKCRYQSENTFGNQGSFRKIEVD